MSENRLSELIAIQISEFILSGKLKSDTKLKQTELADMLGVSRIPVREALQILESQGFVKRLETRHIVVAKINEEILKETFSLIADMEKNVLGMILNHEGWENIRCIINDMSDMQLHSFFITKSDNLYISTLLENAFKYYISFAQKLTKCDDILVATLKKIEIDNNIQQNVISDVIDNYYMQLCSTIIKERKKINEFAYPNSYDISKGKGGVGIKKGNSF